MLFCPDIHPKKVILTHLIHCTRCNNSCPVCPSSQSQVTNIAHIYSRNIALKNQCITRQIDCRRRTHCAKPCSLSFLSSSISTIAARFHYAIIPVAMTTVSNNRLDEEKWAFQTWEWNVSDFCNCKSTSFPVQYLRYNNF